MDYYYFFEHEVNVQKLKWRGSQGIGLCPLPTHDERNPSFSCCGETGQWYCHGCGQKGNAVTLAKLLHFDDPMKYVSGDSNNHTNGRIGGIKPLKTENRHTSQVNNMEKRDDAKKQVTGDLNAIKKKQDEYTNMIPSELKKALKESDWKLVGHDGEGLTFHYPNAIKLHKRPPWWDSDSIDKSCQIFRKEVVLNWDKESKEYLFICEGEKDALFSPCPDQTITFSAGAGKLPNDISNLKPVQNIMLVPDHDDAGYKGKEREAERIKKEFPNSKIFIAQWHESLPKGYDIWDDWKNSQRVTDYDFDEFYNAVSGAKIYKQPKKGFTIMKMKDFCEQFASEDTTPIIKHFVGEKNITLVSGDVDVGKTWTATHMGLCIATGTPFFDTPVSKKKRVVMFQFELSNGEVRDRMDTLSMTYGWVENFQIRVIDETAEIFVDAWKQIEQTCIEEEITDAIIIIDNLYTSTDKNVSDNADLKIVIRHAKSIINKTGNSMILIGHHNKKQGGDFPILDMDIIQGGRTLTANVNYILQIGRSSYSPDVKRGKLTKTRGGYCEIKDIPFMVHFDPDTGMLRKGVIIKNEKTHCIETDNKWQIDVAKDFASYQGDKEFDKERMWQFMSTEESWEQTPSNNTKVSRLLKTLVSWGIFIRLAHNSYVVDLEALASLGKDK